MDKAYISRDENTISLSMGFSKIDRENRRVRGYATFDNVDRQGDIVLAEASQRAFSEFAGNIREMHDSKKAVGKMVSFETTKTVDPETGKQVNGILVDVYVSKGAEDTWQKVLDGTLAGFSIGGTIRDAEPVYKSDTGEQVRVIKSYGLNELSLVDSPANQLANVVSIVKVATTAPNNVAATGNLSIIDPAFNSSTGITFDTHTNPYPNSTQLILNPDFFKSNVENVLYCKKDDVTIISKSENSDCPVCAESMSNIGWVEKGESEAEMIKSLLAKFRKNSETIDKNGGTETMAEAVEETVEAPVVEKSDTAEVSEAVTTDAPTDEVAKSETVEETSNENEVEKSESEEVAPEFDVAKAITDINATLVDITGSIGKLAEALTKGITEVNAEISAVKESTNETTKRLEDVEKSTAGKKSSEVGPSEDGEIQKSHNESFWGGQIAPRKYFN